MHDPTEAAEEDELSAAEVAAFRAQLVALEAELDGQLARASESAQTVDLDAPIGRLTRMDALQRQQMAAAALRRQGQRISQVRVAIQRIDQTDLYGLCTRCEEPIGRRRLSARPESAICMRCQRAADGQP